MSESPQPPRLHLFQAYGVELEYMIVDRKTLDIRPIADELLKHELGQIGGEFVNDVVTWTQEMSLHLIELKATAPVSNFNRLESAFADNVKKINGILSTWDAMLMPTSAHPWMSPASGTKLWPHGANEVYNLYNKIFDTNGHGWSNVHSTHLNLPFFNDEEFLKLHAAIRLLLPILPALCASSPIIEGKLTRSLDNQLHFYQAKQAKIPSITGRVIPETIYSSRQYANTVYEKIREDLAAHDPAHILDPVWVNSRGAVPHFERGSIEIRIMDTQESPPADFAIQTLVIETIKALVSEQFCNHEQQMRATTQILAGILDDTIEHGQSTEILSSEYPTAFGLEAPCTAGDLWTHILSQLVDSKNALLEKWEPELSVILRQGNLSERILKSLNRDYRLENIKETYRHLSDCLAQNKIFIV
ncbi:glutamate-cysteine ligase family protein [soil metagenome]